MTLRQQWVLNVMIATGISGQLSNGVRSHSNHQPTRNGELELLTLEARAHWSSKSRARSRMAELWIEVFAVRRPILSPAFLGL